MSVLESNSFVSLLGGAMSQITWLH